MFWASRARALLAAPTQEGPASRPWSEAVPAGPPRPLRQRPAAPSASTGIWAISPGGTGGGWKADGGRGRGAGVPGGNLAVNHSGEKLGRGLIVPLLTGPGRIGKKT